MSGLGLALVRELDNVSVQATVKGGSGAWQRTLARLARFPLPDED